MDWFWLASTAGAVVTFGLGLMGLARPDAAAAFTRLRPDGLVGRSEIRATYGGFFAVLGASCLVGREPVVFAVVGLAWMGAAAGRLLSVLLDASRSRENLGGVAFEAVVGLLLLAGAGAAGG